MSAFSAFSSSSLLRGVARGQVRALDLSRSRRLLSLFVVGGLVLVTLVALPPPTARADIADSAFDETSAAALAKAQGQRVEVLRLRTETDQVFKNPDGTTTRDQHMEPVRVRRGGAWVPVDSTLTRSDDGSLAPTASAVDMRFSPGGTGPLVTVGRDGVSLSLTWPSALPAPMVSGDSATYPNVYPGVDLALTAVGTSFTQHLIVKTRAAGLLPGVRSMTLGTHVTGGRLVASKTGGFEVVDRGDRPVWSSPAPLMWDSSADAADAAATTQGSLSGAATVGVAGPRLGQEAAREGDNVKAMGQRIETTSMVITPDAALLDSSLTQYPVTIDPSVGPAAIYNWAMVDKTYPTTSYLNFTDADQGVGYQNYSGVSTKRLFLAFNTSWYLGKNVTGAKLSAYETYSGTCAAGTVDAYLMNDVTTGVTWNNQAARTSGILSSFFTKAGRSDCMPGGASAEFNVTNGVKSRLAGGYSRTTIQLAGRSETNVSSWMRFAGPKNATVSHRPTLSVTYNSTPNVPATAKMFAPDTATPCGTTLATTKRFNQNSSTAFMIATGVDPDGGSLSMTFQLYGAAGGLLTTNVVGPLASGAQFKFKVPAGWSDGSYKWTAKVSDGVSTSPTSVYCYITLDKTAPLKPTITSTTFTDDTLAPADVTYGAFTLASVGATSFDYYWNGVLKANLKTNGTSGVTPAWTGNMAIPVSAVGWLQVMAIDGTGNHSVMSNPFFVKKAVGGKLAQYLFNDATPVPPVTEVAADTANDPSITSPAVSVADASHYAFDMSTAGVALDAGRFAEPTCWDPDTGWICAGVQNHSLIFGGTAQDATSEQRPVASERSFTVGAWVQLTDDYAPRTLIAQNLEVNPANPSAAASAYDIGYDQVRDKFVFHVTTSTGAVLTASDLLPSTVLDVTGADVPLERTGKWVYLAAIYDKAAGTIRLDAAHQDLGDPPGAPEPNFVVSVGASTSLGGLAVKAGMGTFRVGDGALNSSPWAGQVDNLSIWQQALGDDTEQNDVATNANQHL